MSKINYLYLRGGTYYFRRAIPRDLQPVLGKAIEVRSLRTGRLSEAKLLAQQLTVELNSTFAQCRGDQLAPPFSLPIAPPHKPQDVPSGPLLSEVVDLFIKDGAVRITKRYDQTNAKRRSVEKRLSDDRSMLLLFVAVAGDRTLNSYRKADGAAFRSFLDVLPKFHARLKELRGRDVEELAALTEANDWETLSDKTVNKYLKVVQALFNWADKRFDPHQLPPTASITKPFLIQDPQPAVKVKPFSVDDLRLLFGAPLYKPYGWRASVSPPDEAGAHCASLFWLPLLAMFTGARMQELCQLYLEDIGHEAVRASDESLVSIPYLNITDECSAGDAPDKVVKNRSSARVIPIHEELIRIGFLEFVEDRQREGHARLFPDLKASPYDGKYSTAFSAIFRRFRRQVGVVERGKVFHSFRHLFEDLGRNTFEVSDDLRKSMMGRSEGGSSGGYGLGFSLFAKHRAMQEISVPGLDLSHIYTNSPWPHLRPHNQPSIHERTQDD